MSHRSNTQHKIDWEELLKSSQTGKHKIIHWDYRDQDKLETFWFSDVHWGHRQCDKDLFLGNVQMCIDREMPCADLGDLIENATRDSVGSGVYEQEEIADQQVQDVLKIYRELAERGLLKSMQPGNHELRTFKSSGVNLTKFIAHQLGVPCGNAGLVHHIRVGDQSYIGYTVHGGSAATTVGGKLTALLRLGNVMDADFYVQGHVHDTLFQAQQKFEYDKSGKNLKTKNRFFINNGAYLDYWNSYGQVKNYSPNHKGNAKITFSGDKRQVEVSFL